MRSTEEERTNEETIDDVSAYIFGPTEEEGYDNESTDLCTDLSRMDIVQQDLNERTEEANDSSNANNMISPHVLH